MRNLVKQSLRAFLAFSIFFTNTAVGLATEIAYTPAALADIAPILKLNDRSYIGQTPLEIGQEMILQFRYTQNNEEILTDQKYSTAGNNEGIFIYFDRLQGNPLLDDPDNPDRKSQILLSGNAYIAREYLRNIQADADLLAKSLDATATVAVNRAVVTQKRLLNRVDDLPTTFDFKGLNIDASSHFNYHSNRTSPELHSDDFTNLWLLSASNYEAQVFEDLTGLNAISTVKGLQYAHANPNDYTVHTITAANENIIDGLNLSANTKQNFHDAVSAGATIITPDRQVQMDNWLGHLYITRNPNGRNNYAIGEQVPGNGGDTVGQLELIEYQVQFQANGIAYDIVKNAVYKTLDNNTEFLAADQIQYDPELVTQGVKCNLSEELHNLRINSPEWQDSWGAPCYKPTNILNNYGYASILTENGVRFHIPNQRDYWSSGWVLRNGARSYLDTKRNLNPNDINYLEDGTLKDSLFSTILGTQMYQICSDTTGANCNHDGNVYYLPTADGGEYYLAKGEVFDKLAEYDNKAIRNLGPPTNEAVELPNIDIISGIKQEFVNGVVYALESPIPSLYNYSSPYNNSGYKASFYSYGPIYDFYQNLGGPLGALGFPIEDTGYIANEDTYYQEFEGARVTGDLQQVSEEEYAYVIRSELATTLNEQYWEGYWDLMLEQGIYGFLIDISSGAAISYTVKRMMQYIAKSPRLAAKLTGKAAARFIPLAGWAFAAYAVIVTADDITNYDHECQYRGLRDDEDSSSEYYCGQRDAVITLVAIGLIGENAASSKTVKNYFGVRSSEARRVKRLIQKLGDQSGMPMESFTRILKKYNSRNRTEFFESIAHFDEAMIKKILNKVDKKGDAFIEKMLKSAHLRKFMSKIDSIYRYEHIFEGNQSGGWHFEKTAGPDSRLISIDERFRDANGNLINKNLPYSATVEVSGQRKDSTFFPYNWSEDQVLEAINEAYNNRGLPVSTDHPYNDTYSTMVNGINITLYVNRNTLKIVSSFPAI